MALALCGLMVTLCAAALAAGPLAYETGISTVNKLTHELCDVLDPGVRRTLHPQPLFLEQVTQPYLQSYTLVDKDRSLRLVVVSSGFVDFLTYLTHAEAIELTEHGFLQRYLNQFAESNEANPVPKLSLTSRHWGFNTMNWQMSRFNQTAGALVAIGLAHHYLGHYQKYASRLVDANNHAIPIATVMTPAEWREAVLKGARNALDCGLALDGLKGFYNDLSKMPVRPSWSYCFLPKDVKLEAIRKDLDRLEGTFFLTGP